MKVQYGPWQRLNIKPGEGQAPMILGLGSLPLIANSDGHITGIVIEASEIVSAGSLLFYIEKNGVAGPAYALAGAQTSVIAFNAQQQVNFQLGGKIRILMATTPDLAPAFNLYANAWLVSPQ